VLKNVNSVSYFLLLVFLLRPLEIAWKNVKVFRKQIFLNVLVKMQIVKLMLVLLSAVSILFW